MNLDVLCARYAQQIVEDKPGNVEIKKLTTILKNAIGVMREDGLFAFYLFLKYKNEEGKHIWSKIIKLWKDNETHLVDEDDESQVIKLTENLSDIFLARRITERTLVYAYYGLRSHEDFKKGEP